MPNLGFTLIETLITLTLIAILAALSFPLLRHTLNQTYAQTLQSQLLNAIDTASHEARNRGVPVTLCASEDRMTCSKTFTNQLIIFTNEKEENSLTSKDQLITVVPLSLHQGHLYWRAYPRYRQTLLFSPSGLLRSDNSTFWFCHKQSTSPTWAVVLNQSGRARVISPDYDGVIKDGHNNALPCHLTNNL